MAKPFCHIKNFVKTREIAFFLEWQNVLPQHLATTKMCRKIVRKIVTISWNNFEVDEFLTKGFVAKRFATRRPTKFKTKFRRKSDEAKITKIIYTKSMASGWVSWWCDIPIYVYWHLNHTYLYVLDPVVILRRLFGSGDPRWCSRGSSCGSPSPKALMSRSMRGLTYSTAAKPQDYIYMIYMFQYMQWSYLYLFFSLSSMIYHLSTNYSSTIDLPYVVWFTYTHTYIYIQYITSKITRVFRQYPRYFYPFWKYGLGTG